MTTWQEFRFVRDGSTPLVWMIQQDGESYSTKHGILDGKLQLNTDTPGPKGKEDTKAYMNAVDNCAFHVSREIRKKTEAGYIEYINGVPQQKRITKIAFDTHLPKVFTGYKPQQNIDHLKLKRICEGGRARYSRKMNGMCHYAVHQSWGWEIYSRRMDKVSGNFPLHIEALKGKFPVGTILVGEMVCMIERDGDDPLDDLNTVARICRSDAEKARNLVKWGEVPEPNYIVFDMLYYDGMPLSQTSYDKRSALWRGEFPEFRERKDGDVIAAVDFYDVKHDTWEEYAVEREWEGFVVTDGNSVPGDKFFSFNGKAKRPNGHHKLKPVFEADVVVFAAKYGTGKRKDGAGSVFCKQIDPNTGKWFYTGGAGSGFTDETLAELQVMLKKHDLPIVKKDTDAEKMNIQNDKGFVIAIEYGDRTPGKNKCQFGVFKRFRNDKPKEECEAEWYSSKAKVELDFLKED